MEESARHLLTQCLALAALIGATIEYGEIVRRRRRRRSHVAELSAVQEAGMRGLVRVFLSEG